MIFVTLGSQKFQFNRLLKKIDNLLKENAIKESVFAQIGYSNYSPKYFGYKAFLDREEFDLVEKKADIIITHGGTGAIISAIKKHKKVIAVPRCAQYHEHVDDHQLQIVREFSTQNYIYGLDNCDDLGIAIEKIQDLEFRKYKSNTERYIQDIKNFLNGDLIK